MAMAMFAIEDALIKFLAGSLPVAQILLIFGLLGASAFAGIALLNGQRLISRAVLSRPMLIRSVSEVLGRVFFVLAIVLTPLSATTVILQATPIVVVAGAAVIFGETVGWRRWLAIFLGMLGVLVIVKPGADGFTQLSLLAVLGMLGFACRDLASRAAPPSLGTAALGFYGFLAVFGAGFLLLLGEPVSFVLPDASTAVYFPVIAIVGVASYSSLMKAMRTGEVSAVAPFRYSRLPMGLALGVVWFDEQLDASIFLGCALIIMSGLLILSDRPTLETAHAS